MYLVESMVPCSNSSSMINEDLHLPNQVVWRKLTKALSAVCVL